MVNLNTIEDFSRRVASEFHPRRIILFGSHAYGKPDDDSDVDLLVVMPDGGDPLGCAQEIRRRVPRSFPLDLIVRDPEVLDRRVAQNDWFLKEILTQGRVLHDADHG